MAIKTCRWCGCSYEDGHGYGDFCSRKCKNEYENSPQAEADAKMNARITKFFLVVIFFPIACIIWMCKKSKTKGRKIAKIVFGIIGISLWFILAAYLISEAGV